MAEFYHGNALNLELEKIFKEAKQQLILFSPFIKLHSRLKSILNQHKENPHLAIKIVYGKNKNRIYKSLSEEEFNYLKEFPNIHIKYDENLHAKYYANEDKALLSSMNLYDYSQNNNIEFGVLTESASFLGEIASSVLGFGHTLDVDAYEYFREVWINSSTKFERVPQIESKVFGLSKRYLEPQVMIDELSGTYAKTNKQKNAKEAKPAEFGYCIRTGEKIPFNPKQPMSKRAWNTWNKFGNENFPEKYCHKTGAPSNGKTSMRNPIMN